MKFEFSQQIFEKRSGVNFYQNPSIGCWVVPCGQMDGRTNMTKPVFAFRNLANAPKTAV